VGMRGLKYIYIYKREDLRERGDGRWEMLGEVRVEIMESEVSCKEEDEEKKGSRKPHLKKKGQTSEERGRCAMKCIQGSNEYRAASSMFNPFPSSLIMGKRV